MKKLFSILPIILSSMAYSGETGKLTQETWDAIPGYAITDFVGTPRYYSNPDTVSLTSGATSTNAAGAAGVRVRGYVTIPTTGNYSFAICGDDAGELLISPTADKFLAVPAASFSSYTGVGQWTKSPSQQTVEYSLNAGHKIYVEMLLKEGGGADYISLGWKTSTSGSFTDVPASALESYVAADDPHDTNGNEMPDAWEAQYPLPVGQRGLTDDPDKDGYINYEEGRLGTDPTTHGGVPGYLSYERWDWVGATNIESLLSHAAYRTHPDTSELVAGSAMPSNQGDYYGAKLHGYLIAPFTGTFQLSISGDDNVALYLSSDESKFNSIKIAEHDNYTYVDQFDYYDSQTSAPITLQEGQKYYIQALLNEGVASDHLSLAWSGIKDGTINWAANPSTTMSQSTTAYNGVPERAIDGNRNGEWAVGSSTYTDDENNPWIQADLAQDRQIQRVVIYNRPVYQHRLTNFRISVINSAGTVVATQDFHTNGSHTGDMETWSLPNPVSGKLVKLELLGNGVLTIAELEILDEAASFPIKPIPSSALESYAYDLDDVDNDGIKDSWELAHGLDTSKNDALEDPDSDNAPNWLEFESGSDPQVKGSVGGGLNHDLWDKIPGRHVKDLTDSPKYYATPDYSSISTWSGGPYNWDNNHGNRLRGFITAPETGNYFFWAKGNKQVVLSLSTNEDKFNKEKLIETVQFNNLWQEDYDYDLAQKSRAIHLVAGQKYFIEVLHKSTDWHGDHFAFAWTTPDGERGEIPSHLMSTFPGQENDADDDGLEDSWELANGLDASIANGNHGAGGDLDGDGLSNLEESLAGTLANQADTDGDGFSDYEEIMILKTDYLSGDLASFQQIQTIPAHQYSSKRGEWLILPSGITNSSTRGELEYDIEIPSDGVFLLNLAFESHLGGNVEAEYLFNVTVDGVRIEDAVAHASQGATMHAKVLTQYLKAGQHKVKIFFNNSHTYRKVKLLTVSVESAQGPDEDNNNRPDWVDAKLQATNGINGGAIRLSKVSPALVEGNARYLAQSNISGVTANSAPGDKWYGYVNLQSDGNPTTVTGSFENAALTDTQQISWIHTNLLAETEISVRAGSSLRLTAANAANGTASEFVEIQRGQDTFSFVADQPELFYFGVPGQQILSVTHTQNGIVQTKQITINVIPDVLLTESPIVVDGYWRDWTVGSLPNNHILEFDDRIIVRETQKLQASTVYTLTNTGTKTVPAIVRNQITGDIIGRVEIRGMSLRDNDLTSISVIDKMEDGTSLIEMPIVVDGMHSDATIRYDIFIGGVLFEDGTISKDWTIPDDFDDVGVGKVRFIKSGTWGAACHRASIWQNGQRIAFLY